MANVLFTRKNASEIPNVPITDGQLIFSTSGNGKMYLDNGTERLEMGGALTVDATLSKTSTNPVQNKAVAGVMLDTLSDIGNVTSKGFLTDALAVKELNTNVNELNNSLTVPEDGVKYYADKKDGKYGVNTDPSRGADTFIPFSGSNIELLWTNPSPSANFPAQTLSLDLTDYDAVIIELKHNASATQVRRELCIKGYTNRVLTSANGQLIGGDMWGRNVTVNEDSLVFGTPTTASNQIPTRIYGVKYEDFANLTPIG